MVKIFNTRCITAVCYFLSEKAPNTRNIYFPMSKFYLTIPIILPTFENRFAKCNTMENNFTYDWTQFVQRIPVTAPVQEIYDAWTSQNALESWFLRNAAFTSVAGQLLKRTESIQVGDTYEWQWFGWSDDVTEKGEILEADGKNQMSFVFGKAGIVSVRIYAEGDQSILELTQHHIPTDEKSRVNFHVGCSNGWTFYLANLKSILEGGLDLRNKDEELKGVLNS